MISDLRFQLAIQGNLEVWADRVNTAYLTALKGGVADEGVAIQTRLRNDVTAAGLGQGVANAWRLEVHPKGSRLANSPSAFLFSRAAHIVESFGKGEPIRARNGLMAVPVPGSPADQLKLRKGMSLIDEITRRFGPLRLVVLKRGLRMLVAQGKERGGRMVPLTTRTHTKSGARFTPLGQARTEIPMFWLVPQVRLAKRLSWNEIARASEMSFGRRVEDHLKRRMAEAEAAINRDFRAMPPTMMDDNGRAIAPVTPRPFAGGFGGAR